MLVTTTPAASITVLQDGKEVFRGESPVTRDFAPGPYTFRIENAPLQFREDVELTVEEGKLAKIERILNLASGSDAGSPGTPASNLTEAQVVALKNSADQGDAEACYRLGKHYAGKGNAEDAYQMLRLAAAKDHIGAQYELGVLFHTGAGVAKDDEASLYWLLKAALGGNKAATPYLTHGNYPAEYQRDINNQQRIDLHDFKGADLNQMQRLRLDELKQSLEKKQLPV